MNQEIERLRAAGSPITVVAFNNDGRLGVGHPKRHQR